METEAKKRNPWVLIGAGCGVVGVLAVGVVMVAAVGLLVFGSSRDREEPTWEFPSPDGSKVAVADVDRDSTDPRVRNCVRVTIRDVESGEVVFRQTTVASHRMRWGITWLDEDTIQMDSSDIGTKTITHDTETATWTYNYDTD